MREEIVTSSDGEDGGRPSAETFLALSDEIAGRLDALADEASGPLETVRRVIASEPIESPLFGAIADWGVRASRSARRRASSTPRPEYDDVPDRGERWTDSEVSLRQFQRELQLHVAGAWVSSAWHDDASIAVPVSRRYDAVEFQYRPNTFDRSYFELARDRWASQGLGWSNAETRLDLRGFFGNGTIATFGQSILQPLGSGWRRALVATGRTSGVILTTVSRWVGRRVRLTNDPDAEERVATAEERYPDVALRVPRLELGVPVHPAPLSVVLVHGTASCGMVMARALPRLKVPAYRFEHDTYETISANGKQLAQLCRTSLDTPRILFVAHSRGGLVARFAAAQLAADQHLRVSSWTLGSPHTGTPLVDAYWLAGLYYLAECLASGDTVDAFSAGLRYALNLAAPPPGIEAMRAGSDFLEVASLLPPPRPPLRSFGGAFDDTCTPFGVGFSFEHAATQNLFNGEENDGVVGLSSAVAFGRGHRIADPCNHFLYMHSTPVMRAMSRLGQIS